jgi:tol-pal system protein YbgF
MRLAVPLCLVGLFGCTSSGELAQVSAQLADVQRQLQQIREASPDRGALEGLGSSVRGDLAQLLRAHADLLDELRRIDARIEQLEAKLVDAHGNFGELSAQIAMAQHELEGIAQILAESSSGEGASTPAGASQPADPETLYQSAYNDYLRGNYDVAIESFRRYLGSFPGSQLADNAQYWIGECLFHQQKFRDAVAEFDRVATSYPTSERLASAMLRKGYALLEVGDAAAARQALQAVVQRFPRSDEAILAQRQLDTLGRQP